MKPALDPHVRELMMKVSGRTFPDKAEGWVMDDGDQVKRLRRFEAGHPEWKVISPKDIRSVLRGDVQWRADGPHGEAVYADELRDLLDEIEEHR